MCEADSVFPVGLVCLRRPLTPAPLPVSVHPRLRQHQRSSKTSWRSDDPLRDQSCRSCLLFISLFSASFDFKRKTLSGVRPTRLISTISPILNPPHLDIKSRNQSADSGGFAPPPFEERFALIRLTQSSCLMCVESIWSSLMSRLQSCWKTLHTASTFLRHPFIVRVITLLATVGSGRKGAAR